MQVHLIYFRNIFIIVEVSHLSIETNTGYYKQVVIQNTFETTFSQGYDKQVPTLLTFLVIFYISHALFLFVLAFK